MELQEYLERELQKSRPVNEFLITMAASAIVLGLLYPKAYSVIFAGTGAAVKGAASGTKKAAIGLGHLFGIGVDRVERKRQKLENKEKALQNREKELELKEKERQLKNKEKGESDETEYKFTGTPEQQNSAFNNVLAIAETRNKDEKDETQQQKNQQMIDVLRASSIDDDGNPLPLDQIGDRMEQVTGQTHDELTDAWGVSEPTEKELQDTQESLTKELENKTEKEREDIGAEGLVKAKESAKKIKEQLEKEETAEKEVKDLEDQLEEEQDEEKKKELEEQLEESKKKLEEVQSTAIVPVKKEKITSTDQDLEGEPEGTTVSKEEVIDKETGKKTKKKVYTGPRGGRFYYPDGAPHDTKHKVYVDDSLASYLANLFD